MKRVTFVMLFGLAVIGVVYAGTRPEEMNREEKNKLLVKVAMQAINAGDWENMSELFSPQFVQHQPGNQKTTNWTDFELACRVIRQKIPTARIEIEDIIAEGNKVAARLKTVVTYKEKHYRGSTTEREIEFTEMNLFRIEGNKIIEEWSEYDTKDWKTKLWKSQNVKTWE